MVEAYIDNIKSLLKPRIIHKDIGIEETVEGLYAHFVQMVEDNETEYLVPWDAIVATVNQNHKIRQPNLCYRLPVDLTALGKTVCKLLRNNSIDIKMTDPEIIRGFRISIYQLDAPSPR